MPKLSDVELKPIHTIEVDLGIEDNGPMQQELTNLVYKYMFRYIPYSGATTGPTSRIHLRENTVITEDSITFTAPYATYQYYGVREDGTHKVRNYTTPGTGPYWDKVMLTAHRQDIIKELQEKYGRK